MGLKRRAFLKQTGLMLAALGMSEAVGYSWSDRYYQALAQPTNRKLALLVGINQYPKKNDAFEPLQGGVTDVKLQEELLIHRFGFQPQDVLTLTDEQATREAIESAFVSHLIEQAKGNDLVVFHFSGYGCYLPRSESGTQTPQVQPTLVPIDGTPPQQETTVVNDLPEDTLWLLLRSLQNTQIVTILDTSYNYPGAHHQGILRIRSSDTPIATELTEAARLFQAQLLEKLNLSADTLEQRRPHQLPGVVLTATKPGQIATEITRDGYSAGLFTTALTQSLWLTPSGSSTKVCFSQVAGQVERVMSVNQQPQLYQQIAEASNDPLTLFPFTSVRSDSIPAVGTIQEIEDNGNIKVFLTGLPEPLLECYEANSLLTVLQEAGGSKSGVAPQLIIQSRAGLIAKATLWGAKNETTHSMLRVGQQLQEAIRVLPRQIDLNIAIDPKLTRIERVDATSAFSSFANVSVVKNEQSADYLLSRVRDTTIAQTPNTPLIGMFQGRYGLFSLGQALLPESVGEGGEAVKVAVQRLAPQLETRLAAKLLSLTLNSQSTLLQAKASFAQLTPQSQILITQQTPQLKPNPGFSLLGYREPKSQTYENRVFTTAAAESPVKSSQGMISIPIGSRIQYQLKNNGDLPIYFIWFRFDGQGQAYVLDPIMNGLSNSDEMLETQLRQKRVPPNKVVSLPTTNPYDNIVSEARSSELLPGPAGLIESYLILSHTPFTQTLNIIQEENRLSHSPSKLLLLSNPLTVAKAVLEDLSIASQLGVERTRISTDHLALDVNAWASFSFLYRVV